MIPTGARCLSSSAAFKALQIVFGLLLMNEDKNTKCGHSKPK